MPDALAEALRRILPPGVGLGIGADLPVWPGEELGPTAVPARLREFRGGRAAARGALQAAGFASAAIPVDTDRAPIWPQGVVGSISHCAGACLAIAADKTVWAGIGIDLEPLVPIARDLWDSILAPGDLPPGAAPNGLDVLQVFVAKEAAYKAQYALSRQLFGFHTLRMDGANLRFCATVPPFQTDEALPIQLVRTEHHLAAICLIPAQA